MNLFFNEWLFAYMYIFVNVHFLTQYSWGESRLVWATFRLPIPPRLRKTIDTLNRPTVLNIQLSYTGYNRDLIQPLAPLLRALQPLVDSGLNNFAPCLPIFGNSPPLYHSRHSHIAFYAILISLPRSTMPLV